MIPHVYETTSSLRPHLAMTAAICQYLAEHPDHFDPRQYLKPTREKTKKMYIHKIVDVLGSDGKLAQC